jgi:hypothetical protein
VAVIRLALAFLAGLLVFPLWILAYPRVFA